MNVSHATTDEIASVKSLSREESEELKRQILTCDPCHIFTVATNKTSQDADKRYIICPHCGNGTGKDATPVDVSFKGDRWLYHCFSHQDLEGDLLNIIAAEHNLDLHNRDDMAEALAVGANLIGYPIADKEARKNFKPAQIPKKVENSNAENSLRDTHNDSDLAKQKILPLIHNDIELAKQNISYLHVSERRGLNMQTLMHFNFGYLDKWTHPKLRLEGKTVPPSRRIIIPTENHYHAVALPSDRQNMESKYWKIHAGSMELFNPDALNSDFIIVVEGEFDAASIWQAYNATFQVDKSDDIAVVAVLGAANYERTLLSKLQGLSNKKFLILFDADNAGRDNAEKLRKKLINLGFPAACRSYYDFLFKRIKDGKDSRFEFDDKIDANEILQKSDGYFLHDLTEKIIADAQADFDKQAKQAESDKIFNEKITEFEAYNAGRINPTVVQQLKKAVEYLDSLTADNITVSNAQSGKTKHAIALCKFYDSFAESAANFFARLELAKSNATNKIKRLELAGNADAESLCKLQALVGVSVRDIKAEVGTRITEIKKEYKHFREEEEHKAAQAELERKLAKQAAQDKANTDRLKELLAAPQSKERDTEIVSVIRELCDWKRDKLGNPIEIRGTQANMDLFLNDPNINGLIGYDEFQQADVFLKAPTWRRNVKKGDLWTDRDDAQFRTYLRRTYSEFSAERIIFDTLINCSETNSFHEVKDYFRKLPKWDGKKRAERFFIDWLKVDDSPFAREVTLKWLLGAIARIFNPGCKFQWSLVLHGNQKIGKGFVLERLGGKWYIPLTDRVDDPHIVDAIQKMWIGEFKEMAAMRKAELNAIKQFLELSADTRRFAYDRRAKTILRHCVFAITVNDDKFLSDLTGNRRFLILHSNLPKFGYVKEVEGESLNNDNVIAQIWAEVYELYNEMFKDGFDERKLELSSDTEFQGEKIAENYLRDEEAEGQIKSFVDQKIPEPIWDLLSKEERRKFFAEGGKLILVDGLTDLNKRCRVKGGRNLQQTIDKIYNFMHSDFVTENQTLHGGKTVDEFWIYGSDYRQHVCAAEIANECFGNDKKISCPKIIEVLKKITGWEKSDKRIARNFAYGDQKTIFFRKADNIPDDEPNQPDDLPNQSANINSSENKNLSESFHQ